MGAIWHVLMYEVLGYPILSWLFFACIVTFIVWLALTVPPDNCGMTPLGLDCGD
jgi:hypothetical protein